jgi:CRISPR-associated protein (Cas_Cmr5)
MTLPPRVDHDLARLAAQTLDSLRDQRTGKVPGEVITRLTGLPALLRTSGPLATLAFFASKAGGDKPLPRAYAAVGSAFQAQVAGELGLTLEENAPFAGFVLRLTGETIPPEALARATARLEEFALWLRRLAEAVEQEQARA